MAGKQGGKAPVIEQKGDVSLREHGRWERFNEPKLLEKEKFYSELNDEHITDEDYEYAQKDWEAFGCKSLLDYHDIFLGTDVALLADVFENIRKLSLPQAVRASPRALIHVPRFDLGYTAEEGQNRAE